MSFRTCFVPFDDAKVRRKMAHSKFFVGFLLRSMRQRRPFATKRGKGGEICRKNKETGRQGDKETGRQGDREIKWSTFVISSVIERSLHALRLVEMTKGKSARDDKRVVEALSRDLVNMIIPRQC